MLFTIRVPAALPALGAGLRVAAAGAPLGAIVGEWVGASSGLGLLMLHANARMQTDMVFAGLVVLVVFSVALWAAVGFADPPLHPLGARHPGALSRHRRRRLT